MQQPRQGHRIRPTLPQRRRHEVLKESHVGVRHRRRRPQLEHESQELEDVRLKLDNLIDEEVLKGRKERALKGRNVALISRAREADGRREGLEHEMVEAGLIRVARHEHDNRLELVNNDAEVRQDGLVGGRNSTHDG